MPRSPRHSPATPVRPSPCLPHTFSTRHGSPDGDLPSPDASRHFCNRQSYLLVVFVSSGVTVCPLCGVCRLGLWVISVRHLGMLHIPRYMPLFPPDSPLSFRVQSSQADALSLKRSPSAILYEIRPSSPGWAVPPPPCQYYQLPQTLGTSEKAIAPDSRSCVVVSLRPHPCLRNLRNWCGRSPKDQPSRLPDALSPDVSSSREDIYPPPRAILGTAGQPDGRSVSGRYSSVQ